MDIVILQVNKKKKKQKINHKSKRISILFIDFHQHFQA